MLRCRAGRDHWLLWELCILDREASVERRRLWVLLWMATGDLRRGSGKDSLELGSMINSILAAKFCSDRGLGGFEAL